MTVLIVESNRDLGALWKRHIERQGNRAMLVHSQNAAIDALRDNCISCVVLDLVLEEGSALAVADYASYRYPNLNVVFVTSSTFFSDGSIFRHAPNACAYLPTATRPDDLAAMVEHYAARD